jgi:hypothetical protein
MPPIASKINAARNRNGIKIVSSSRLASLMFHVGNKLSYLTQNELSYKAFFLI